MKMKLCSACCDAEKGKAAITAKIKGLQPPWYLGQR